MPSRLFRVFLAAFPLLTTPTFAQTDSMDIGSKRVFKEGHPALIAFRGEMDGPSHKSYETWSESLKDHSVIIRKFWNEELKISPETTEWAQRYLNEHPDTMFLWHLNAEARAVRNLPDVQKRYFPGHWALHTGSSVSAPVSEETHELPVEHIDRFSMKGYLDRRQDVTHPHDLVIVERLADGSMNWDKCEYAKLLAINADKGTISVERGSFGSQAQDYSTNGAYVAPIVAGVWGGQILWFYNHASTCPKDEDGRQASEIFVDEIIERFDPESGDLKGFSGVAFDVLFWVARWPEMDVDADGKTDNGIIDGKNVWLEGMMDWTTRVRQAMGEEFIIVADGGSDKHQRAVGLLSGMESEGFPFHHDAFRGYSTPLNHFMYWKEFGDVPYPFNFSALKFKSDFDVPNYVQYTRLGLGTMLCLDIHATTIVDEETGIPLDEYVAGNRSQPHWLGQAIGEPIHLELQAPDLLEEGGVKWSDELLSHISIKGDTLSVDSDGVLLLQGNAKNPQSPIELTIKDLPRPEGDVILEFEARSEVALAPVLEETPVPRTMTVTVDELPEYEDSTRKNDFYNDLGGAFGTVDYIRQAFYFRKVGDVDSEKMTIHVSFENQGALRLRNLRLRAGSQAIAREFEHGVVLANPSFDDITFDLNELFPDYKGAYRRIAGKQPANDGSPITDPDKVLVPALDSVFLEKN